MLELNRAKIAEKFERVGAGSRAAGSIGELDFAILGLKYQKTFKSLTGKTLKITYDKDSKGIWKNLCGYVYESLTHLPVPDAETNAEYGKLASQAILSAS